MWNDSCLISRHSSHAGVIQCNNVQYIANFIANPHIAERKVVYLKSPIEFVGEEAFALGTPPPAASNHSHYTPQPALKFWPPAFPSSSEKLKTSLSTLFIKRERRNL